MGKFNFKAVRQDEKQRSGSAFHEGVSHLVHALEKDYPAFPVFLPSIGSVNDKHLVLIILIFPIIERFKNLCHEHLERGRFLIFSCESKADKPDRLTAHIRHPLFKNFQCCFCLKR